MQTKTAKQRKATLFRYRLVITMPPWAVLVMGGAIGLAFLRTPEIATNAISFALVFASLVCVVISRRHVNALRHDIHEALNNIGNDSDEIEHELVDYEPEAFQLKRVNGKRSARVSE
jgi:hypothetical protein